MPHIKPTTQPDSKKERVIGVFSFKVASVVKRGKKEFCREKYQLEKENYHFKAILERRDIQSTELSEE